MYQKSLLRTKCAANDDLLHSFFHAAWNRASGGIRSVQRIRWVKIYKHLEAAERKCEDRSTLELIEAIRVLLKIIEPPSVNLRVKRMDTPRSKPFHARRRTVQSDSEDE